MKESNEPVMARLRRGAGVVKVVCLDVGYCLLYPEGDSLLLTHEDLYSGAEHELSLTRADVERLYARIGEWLDRA